MRVTHEFEPFYDENSKILILGSIPSPKSRELGFYYMHPQNRFWKVLSSVFGEEVPLYIDDKKQFLKRHNIALWDVLESCDIDGASDSSIKNPIPNDIEKILENSKVEKIYTTGKTAHKLYNKYILNKIGIEAKCLSSTSPANARMSLEELVNEYKSLLK